MKNKILKILKWSGISFAVVWSFLLGSHIGNNLIVKGPIDPALQPYYQGFLKESELRNNHWSKLVSVSMTFNEENSGALGVCTVLFGFQNKITINKKYWNSLNETQKEMTVYHELAHCILLKGHSLEERNQTLMSKSIFNHHEYLSQKDAFLDNLFGYDTKHIPEFLISFMWLEKPATKMGLTLKN